MTPHAEWRRGRILDAARALFEERGYDFTIAQLAEQAHISVGALSLYFASKNEVLAHLCHADLESFVGDMREVLDRYLPFRKELAALEETAA